MKQATATKKCAEAKEILQTKSGTLGGAGDPPWWFFRVKFFIRFLDVSPPNKNSQTNGFSPKFPTFFLCKKNQIESDGWTSLVTIQLFSRVLARVDYRMPSFLQLCTPKPASPPFSLTPKAVTYHEPTVMVHTPKAVTYHEPTVMVHTPKAVTYHEPCGSRSSLRGGSRSSLRGGSRSSLRGGRRSSLRGGSR